MKCPYNHMVIRQVYQDTYEYDEDGRQTVHQNMLHETREFGNCLEEGCAAWHDGRCHYYNDS